MDLHLFSLYPLSVAVFLGLEAYHNVRRNLGKSIRVASFKLNILYLLGILLILYYFSCRFHFWLLDQFEISIVEYLLICQTPIDLLPPYTHLGDVEEIFNPLGVSLGASESKGAVT
jgi:hypothetical protein